MELKIEGPFIKLGQAMKAAKMVSYGSDAKALIQSGQVKVNGETDLRRGRKLVPGDQVEYEGKTLVIL